MNKGFAEIVALLAAALAPTTLGLLGALALAAPFNLFEGYAPTPILALYPIFYWSLFAPEQMPAPAVFAIGVVQDLALGGPLGLWALAFLSVHGAVLWQREFFLGRAFSALWTGFGFAAVMAGLIVWLSASALYGRPLAIWPLAYQIAATILIYPLFHGAVRLARRRGAADY